MALHLAMLSHAFRQKTMLRLPVLGNVVTALAVGLLVVGVAYLVFDVRHISLWAIMIVLAGSLLGVVIAASWQRS